MLILVSALLQVGVTTGSSQPNGCSGNIAPIPRLNFTGLCLNDNGNGLRATDWVSSFPSGIHMGARYVKAVAVLFGKMRLCVC